MRALFPFLQSLKEVLAFSVSEIGNQDRDNIYLELGVDFGSPISHF